MPNDPQSLPGYAMGMEAAAKIADAEALSRAQVLTSTEFDPRTDWDDGIEVANKIAAAIRAHSTPPEQSPLPADESIRDLTEEGNQK